MNKIILKIVNRKVNNLIEKYDGFNNIILDNWRGYKLIYDADNFLLSKKDGKRYRLAFVLKNEKNEVFNFGLFLANYKDKKMFGSQKYLNCKSIEQYRNCYLNFIKQISTQKELKEELSLVKNLSIVYSKKINKCVLEKMFKKSILTSTIVKDKILNLDNK